MVEQHAIDHGIFQLVLIDIYYIVEVMVVGEASHSEFELIICVHHTL